MTTRKPVAVLAAVVVFVLLIVPSASVGDTVSGSDQSDPASTSVGAPALSVEVGLVAVTPAPEDGAQADTDQPEPARPPEDEATAEIVSE